jgi:hypothetical protein
MYLPLGWSSRGQRRCHGILRAEPPEEFPASITGATGLQDEFWIGGIAIHQADTRKAAIAVGCVVALIVQGDGGPIEIAQNQRLIGLVYQTHDDQALLQDVAHLLREDAEASSLLEWDVAHVAHEVLGDGSTPAAEQFGRYRIKRTQGAGGMGIVYLAEREDLGSLVAVKILRVCTTPTLRPMARPFSQWSTSKVFR